MTKLILKYLTILLFISSYLNANVEKKDLACYFLNNFYKTFEKLTDNPKSWMRDDDSCVLGIIDSLNYYSIKENNVRFIIILDSISSNSDGYISESIQFCIGNIFSKKPKLLIKYLYEIEKLGRKNNLKNYLMWYLIDKYNLGIPQEQKSGIKDLKKELLSIENKFEFTSQEKLFIQSLESEIIKISN